MIEKKYCDMGIMNFADAIINDCFEVPSTSLMENYKVKKNFAINSKIVGLWCNYKNVDDRKVRVAIVNFNSRLLEDAISAKKQKKVDKIIKYLSY